LPDPYNPFGNNSKLIAALALILINQSANRQTLRGNDKFMFSPRLASSPAGTGDVISDPSKGAKTPKFL
jgi:hypothetical protein